MNDRDVHNEVSPGRGGGVELPDNKKPPLRDGL